MNETHVGTPSWGTHRERDAPVALPDRLDARRLVFVGGPERSGTTLLQNILDSHPDIHGTPPFIHLEDMLALRKKFHHSVEQGFMTHFCDRDDVDCAVNHMIARLLGPAVEKSETRLVSEKTPGNALVFDGIHTLLPQARFILVVRDPRAIISSLLAVGERGKRMGQREPNHTRRVRDAIRRVRRHLAAGFDFAKRNPAVCWVVRYEDLVLDPEAETRRVCVFLGIEWTEAMLRPSEVDHPGEKSARDAWYTREEFRRDPEPSRVHAWKETLRPRHQVLVTRAFGGNEHFARLGYDLNLNHLGPWRRATGQLDWAFSGARYRLFRWAVAALDQA
jgi:hypothetical protein